MRCTGDHRVTEQVFPEVVGDAGLMVDPFDVEAIARGIAQLLDDEGLRSQLRAKGLDRARMFNWRETAKRTLEVYKLAVDNNGQKVSCGQVIPKSTSRWPRREAVSCSASS